MATQSSIVVLAPIVVEIGRDLDASVSAVGQARTILSAVAVACSLMLGRQLDRLGVRPVLIAGAALALAGAGLSAVAPGLAIYYVAQVPVGAGVACLLSAGFAGVASFFDEEEAVWAMGYVVAAQSVSWIVGNPIIGVLTDAFSWRAAYAVPAAIALIALAAGLAAPRGGRVPGDAESGVRAVLADPSARRWALAELVAYAAWTAELTYVGAFYIQSYGIEESTVGLLLAGGSFSFMAATFVTARLTLRHGRRRLAVASALGMGLMLIPVLNLTPSVSFTFGLFCVMALFAGLRTTSSSSLGLAQLPDRPGSMAAARTTSAQLGYALGALAGGAVLAAAGFGTLGFVLCAGMGAAALLLLRVEERELAPGGRRGSLAPAVPD